MRRSLKRHTAIYVRISTASQKTDRQQEELTSYAELNQLNFNRNLILTGAPGTGKTYLAKQIAQQLIFDEAKENLTDDEQKQFDEQCGFVQFHPSYDYTDFVEGLRPIQDDNGNVGFERKDGVFKEFCKKALKNTTVISDNFDECWEKLVTKLEDESFIKIPNLSWILIMMIWQNTVRIWLNHFLLPVTSTRLRLVKM